MERGSGILLHISSLPNKFGMGCISKEAYNFVDFLKQSGQKYWQVLPLNPTDQYACPYLSNSQFAGNLLLIDMEEFFDKATLKAKGFSSSIKYSLYEKKKVELLKQYYEKVGKTKKLSSFIKENEYWINDYAVYMALKEEYSGGFLSFPKELQDKNSATTKLFIKNNKEKINFYIFAQYLFFSQWNKLKSYANSQQIKIIGDTPIYVSMDSSDVWFDPKNFLLDKNYLPTGVSGVPKDYFNENGQLWGNPLYNYAYMKKQNYSWWVQRMLHLTKMYDIIRIDHFRGFESYYKIPYGATDVSKGKWCKGSGYALFKELAKHPIAQIVLEDLGVITSEVQKLKDKTGFPGMKVFQFAFDGNSEHPYLTHNYEKNCIAYLGTHDNDTFVGFLEKLDDHTKSLVTRYLHLDTSATPSQTTYSAIESILASNAVVCILTPADLLCQDSRKRINIPGTISNSNWKYKLGANELNANICTYLKDAMQKYNR